MDKALYIAMSGAKNNMLAQRIEANNLANASTTGFKEDFAQARSVSVYGEHYPTRAYALTENPATNFEQGPMIQTGRELDIAVKGDGWIALQDPEGGEVYTRAGSMQIDVNGVLRAANGLPVMGEGGPIAIPPAAKVEIGSDGTISVIPLGETPENIAEVDRIKLVNPDAQALRKGEDGLLRLNEGGVAELDPNLRIETGFVEGSNVNTVDALTSVLTLARQYELSVKVMQTADENSQSAARLLQLS